MNKTKELILLDIKKATAVYTNYIMKYKKEWPDSEYQVAQKTLGKLVFFANTYFDKDTVLNDDISMIHSYALHLIDSLDDYI